MKLFNKSLFEIIYNIKYFNIDKSLEDISRIKNLPKDEFINWQNQQRNYILKYHLI